MSVLIRYLLTITSDTELATDSVSAAKVLPAGQGRGGRSVSTRGVRGKARRRVHGYSQQISHARYGVAARRAQLGAVSSGGEGAHPNLAMAAERLAAREPAGALQAPGARGYAAERTAGLRAWLPRVS